MRISQFIAMRLPRRPPAWLIVLLVAQGSARAAPGDPQAAPTTAPTAGPAEAAASGPAGPPDFNTDTPGKGYTPNTVPAGYFQIESDIFHITNSDGVQTIQVLDPVFKYGVSDTIDVEVQTGGLINMATTEEARTVRVTGYGDTLPVVKWNPLNNVWGVLTASARFAIKLPTASPGLGDGAVEYALALPAQIALPANFSLQLEQDANLLRNQNDNGKHFSYSEIASLGKTFGNTTISGELFAQRGTDNAQKPVYTADLGASYLITPSVLISFAANFGLNRYAPRVEAYSGFGFRF
jgi:hypothetical protein